MNHKRHKQIATALGASIAKMRLSRGLTQEQVAERLDIGSESISRIERGAVMPPIIRIYQMAEVFDCRVDELFREGSDRSVDLAAGIAQQIDKLMPKDRELVLEILGKLVRRLPVAKGKH